MCHMSTLKIDKSMQCDLLAQACRTMLTSAATSEQLKHIQMANVAKRVITGEAGHSIAALQFTNGTKDKTLPLMQRLLHEGCLYGTRLI